MLLKEKLKLILNKILSKIRQIYKDKANIIGIDLGTANTLICIKDKGVVLNEASSVSYVIEDGEQIGHLYGNKAKELLGKTPFKIEVANPIEDGVVNMSILSENMVRQFMSNVYKKNSLFQPTVIVGVPFSASEVEKKALQEIIEKCNTKECFLIYESIASAIGAGIDIHKPSGSLIIDIGGGTTELSVISLGGIIKNRSFKYGGRKIDKSIINYLSQKYHLLIGENTAENIKKQIGSVFIVDEENNKSITITGRNLNTNTPQDFTITQKDVVIATAEFTNLLIDNLKELLEITSPELIKDISKNGIHLCGGVANLQSIDYIIETITGIKVNIPKNPELCLVKGLNKIVQNYKQYSNILFKQI